MKTAFQTPEFNNTFFTINGPFLNECQIIDEREKAVKVKVQSFVAYPGVSDKMGDFKGFAWIPKSALIPSKTMKDTYSIAKWAKIEFRRA